MKKIFKEYGNMILTNKKWLKQLINGELPIIDSFDNFKEIKEIIDFYNDAYQHQDWGNFFPIVNKRKWIWDSCLASLFYTTTSFDSKTLEIVIEKYERNYNCFRMKIRNAVKKLVESKKKDQAKNTKKLKMIDYMICQ